LIVRTAALLALVVLAAGCGAPAKPPVEDAVRSYTAAFLSGRGDAAANMLSARCNTAAMRGAIVTASANAAALYGQAKLVSVTPNVDGDHATVTYRFDQPAIDQENQPWVFEGGSWRYDKC
jgi:hypothetical protein